MSIEHAGVADRRPPVFILWIGLAALLVRIVYLWTYSRALPFLGQPVLDAAYYDNWAWSILQGQLFPAGPFYQAPGYPWFLALVYKVLGYDPVRAVIVQALLGTMTIVMTAWTAFLLFGRKEALLSGILLIGAGSLYFFESRLLVETLALFLLTASTLLTVFSDRNLRVAANREERRAFDRAITDGLRPARARGTEIFAAGLAGLLAGAASVTRPNLIVIPAAFLVIALARAIGHRRPWSTTLVYAGFFSLALVPTTVHNLRAGAPTLVATSGGLNFYIGNHRGARGIYEDPPGFSGIIARQEAEADSIVSQDLGAPLPPGPESGYWMSKAFAEIAADPPGWLVLEARKAWLFVNGEEEDNNGSFAFERSRVIPLRLAAIPFNFFAIVGLVGLILALGAAGAARGARGHVTPLVLMLVGVFFTGLVFFVMARLRMAALPALAIFTAHALHRTDVAWKEGQRRPVIAVGVAALALIAMTWPSPLGKARNPGWESRLFMETGMALEAKGKKDRAAAVYQEAASIDPKNANAFVHLGQMSMENRDLLAAISWFEKARNADSEDFGVRNNLGILYYQAKRFADADRELNTAVRLRPDQPGPFFYRGLVARAAGDTLRAEALFRETLSHDPRFTGAYVRLIESLLSRGDLAEARAWADKAGERAVALPPALAARLR